MPIIKTFFMVSVLLCLKTILISLPIGVLDNLSTGRYLISQAPCEKTLGLSTTNRNKTANDFALLYIDI